MVKVLVVEDDEDSADALGSLLTILGCEVRTARSGSEALTIAASFAPGVVIIDVHMPGMDGFETARRLRTQQLEDCQPMLVTYTAGADASLLDRSKAAGCEHHLVKPAGFDEFEKIIAERRARDSATRS